MWLSTKVHSRENRWRELLTVARRWKLARDGPADKGVEDGGGCLEIDVSFTDADGTLAAIRAAKALARGLNARLTLRVARVVPFPASLEQPPVSAEFLLKRVIDLAGTSGRYTILRVAVHLCRDQPQALLAAQSAHSLVLIGGRKRPWPTAETRLAKRLERSHHRVIVVTAGAAPVSRATKRDRTLPQQSWVHG